MISHLPENQGLNGGCGILVPLKNIKFVTGKWAKSPASSPGIILSQEIF